MCVEVYGAYGQSKFELYRVYNAIRTPNDVMIFDGEGNAWTVRYYTYDDGTCYRSRLGKFVEVTP